MNWWQETNKASVLEYYELKKAGSHERQVLLSICQMLGGYFCFTHPWLTSGCGLLLKWSLQMPASICSRRHCPVNIYLFFFWAWQIQTNQKQIQMTIWWRDELACLLKPRCRSSTRTQVTFRERNNDSAAAYVANSWNINFIIFIFLSFFNIHIEIQLNEIWQFDQGLSQPSWLH